MKSKNVEIYVDENRNIYQGEEAKKRLEENSDFKFADVESGVTKVSNERWEQAQKYEEACWFEALSASDDRNYQHYRTFDKFQLLRGRHFKKAIELGCGPFTNLRVISTVAEIEEVDLEDPLIESYLKHPHVRYNKDFLRNGDFALDTIWVKALRKIFRLFSNTIANKITSSEKVRVGKLFNLPIEDMPTDTQYDLVVIVNVIEHCKDIERIFEVIRSISKPGTIFIFADKKYEGKQVYEMLKDKYFEAGHPLMVDFSMIETFLNKNFKTLFEKTIVEKGEEDSLELEFETYYYIGERL